jgi:hypothetical protein
MFDSPALLRAAREAMKANCSLSVELRQCSGSVLQKMIGNKTCMGWIEAGENH